MGAHHPSGNRIRTLGRGLSGSIVDIHDDNPATDPPRRMPARHVPSTVQASCFSFVCMVFFFQTTTCRREMVHTVLQLFRIGSTFALRTENVTVCGHMFQHFFLSCGDFVFTLISEDDNNAGTPVVGSFFAPLFPSLNVPSFVNSTVSSRNHSWFGICYDPKKRFYQTIQNRYMTHTIQIRLLECLGLRFRSFLRYSRKKNPNRTTNSTYTHTHIHFLLSCHQRESRTCHELHRARNVDRQTELTSVDTPSAGNGTQPFHRHSFPHGLI